MTSNFTKYHLAITKDQYQARQASYIKDNYGLTIDEIPCNYQSFSMLIERVGHLWGWTRRPRYYNNQAELTWLLRQPQSRLFVFRRGGFPVGYAWIVPYLGNKDIFMNSVSKHVIEIENFGFFPEETGKGYGQYILPQIFAMLFQDYDIVYLSSRSTNHKRVMPFYQSLGMEIIHEDILEEDLVPEMETVLPRRRRLA